MNKHLYEDSFPSLNKILIGTRIQDIKSFRLHYKNNFKSLKKCQKQEKNETFKFTKCIKNIKSTERF